MVWAAISATEADGTMRHNSEDSLIRACGED
jgi:hypothetical protein